MDSSEMSPFFIIGSSSHPYITEWLWDNISTVSFTEVSAIVKVGDCSTENYSATTRYNVQCTIKKHV